MQTVIVPRNGGPDVLQLVELDTPEPGSGEVLVDVAAAGVNYIDTYHREGKYPVPTPFSLGDEGAGTIRTVGPDVTGLKAGDRVAWKSAMTGSYATQAIVTAAEAVPVPDNVADEVAAAAMLQGLTAHYLTHSTYPINDGDVVVVHAAAGGVGLLLTQLAKRRGARVIGTASTPDKRQLASAAGADEVCEYDEFVEVAKRLTDGRGADAVYDGVGRSTFDASLSALRKRGMLVLFGASSGPVPPFDLQRLNSGGSLFVTRPTLGHYSQDRDELLSRTNDLFRWIGKDKLTVTIGGRYDLADAAQAHRDLEARTTSGKLLLIPAGS